MVPKKPSQTENEILQQVNRTPIPPELMLGFAERVASAPREEQDREGFLLASIAFFAEHPHRQELSFSAYWRLEALMHTLNEGKLPGWTEGKVDGATGTHPALVAAAALTPVRWSGQGRSRQSKMVFDRQKFLQAAFQQAKNLPQAAAVEGRRPD